MVYICISLCQISSMKCTTDEPHSPSGVELHLNNKFTCGSKTKIFPLQILIPEFSIHKTKNNKVWVLYQVNVELRDQRI